MFSGPASPRWEEIPRRGHWPGTEPHSAAWTPPMRGHERAALTGPSSPHHDDAFKGHCHGTLASHTSPEPSTSHFADTPPPSSLCSPNVNVTLGIPGTAWAAAPPLSPQSETQGLFQNVSPGLCSLFFLPSLLSHFPASGKGKN